MVTDLYYPGLQDPHKGMTAANSDSNVSALDGEAMNGTVAMLSSKEPRG
jgi:hypothetical protein